MTPPLVRAQARHSPLTTLSRFLRLEYSNMTQETPVGSEFINIHDPLTLILGETGTGKTYLTRLEALRLRRDEVSSYFIDFTGEHRGYVERVGGRLIELGISHPGINPFVIRAHEVMGAFSIMERSENIANIIASLSYVPLDDYCRRALGEAVEGVVQRASAQGEDTDFNDFASAISELPVSMHRDTLTGLVGHAAYTNAIRGLFTDSPADFSDIEPSVTVFDLSGLHAKHDESSGPPAVPRYSRMAALSCLETVFSLASSADTFARRLLVIDGFEFLMRHPVSFTAVLNLIKRARQLGLSIILVGQSPDASPGTDQSMVWRANSTVLFRPAPDSLRHIVGMGIASVGGLGSLLDARIGEAMLLSDYDDKMVKVSSSREEHEICADGGD